MPCPGRDQECDTFAGSLWLDSGVSIVLLLSAAWDESLLPLLDGSLLVLVPRDGIPAETCLVETSRSGLSYRGALGMRT